MRYIHRIRNGTIALLVMLVVGIVGYMIIEEWSFIDSLYMTVLTFTTVGYDEVRPLSFAGRIFTIFLMIGGVGAMLYMLTVVMQNIVEEGVLRSIFQRRRMNTRLHNLENHFILCGFGKVGKEVAAEFNRESQRFIIIDNSPRAIVEAEELGYLYLEGDATTDSTLEAAHIDQANGLVASVGNDSDNVYIVLSARGLNPNLTIVARATASETEKKLKIAGADRVISPYTIGGRRLALSAIRPLAVETLDRLLDQWGKTGMRLAEVDVTKESSLAGMSIYDYASSKGLQVLALAHPDGQIVVGPRDNLVVQPGDSLILLGTTEQLKDLVVDEHLTPTNGANTD